MVRQSPGGQPLWAQSVAVTDDRLLSTPAESRGWKTGQKSYNFGGEVGEGPGHLD